MDDRLAKALSIAFKNNKENLSTCLAVEEHSGEGLKTFNMMIKITSTGIFLLGNGYKTSKNQFISFKFD